MKKKSRDEEIRELQEKVFGSNSQRRTFSVLDADEMLQEARRIEGSIDEIKKVNTDLNKHMENELKQLEKMTVNDDLNKHMENELKQIEKMTARVIENTSDVDLERLQQEIKNDFGVEVDLRNEKLQVVQNLQLTAEAFSEIETNAKKNVIGQSDFLHKLVMAFRRPHVVQAQDDKPLNTILIYGPKGSGKHHALKVVVDELNEKQAITSKEISYIDLGLYNTQEDEKLFLQDVYTALKSSSQIITFENAELCFPAYLTRLSDLFVEGKVDLKKRYVVQKEQLVETNTALMKNVVGTLDAKGHYLVLLTDMKKGKIVDLLGADFMNALGDIIETSVLDKETVSEIVKQQIGELIEYCLSKLNIHLTVDKTINEYYESQFIASVGADGLVSLTANFHRALTQYKLEQTEDKVENVTLMYKKELLLDVEGKKMPLSKWLSKEDPMDLEEIKRELDEVVGLTEIKKYVLSLEDNFKIQKMREQQGLKNAAISKHMIFTGNPGTGKTTIARLISKYLRAIGVLSGGQLVEVTRADLVGRYVGHTAPLTMQVIRSALGGVLFIDEAYSLYRGQDDSFGLECIDTIVKGIEDYRDNLIVILAGYKREMSVFLTSNSGLKSRFPNIIDFEDYSGQELVDIAKTIAKSKDYKIHSECDEPLLGYFDKVQKDTSRISGNGRLARNKVEEAILKQSSRLLDEPKAAMDELRIVDFRLDETSFVE